MKEINHKYHNIISDNIKRLRLKFKMSQEKLAEQMGCSREFVSRVENKRERISLNMMFKLSKIFNINPTLFLRK